MRSARREAHCVLCGFRVGDGRRTAKLGQSIDMSDGNEPRKLKCSTIKCCRGTAAQSEIAGVDKAICKIRD